MSVVKGSLERLGFQEFSAWKPELMVHERSPNTAREPGVFPMNMAMELGERSH